jgi:FlaA1/EpsC-like NDP-sugar epimerase
MTLSQSVDLIEFAILNGDSGDTVIPELVSMKLIDLLEIFSEKYNKPIKVTSIRPGEKMLESLINPTQAGRIIKNGSYYHIKSIFEYNETIDPNKLIDYNSKLNPLSKEQLFKYLNDRKLI